MQINLRKIYTQYQNKTYSPNELKMLISQTLDIDSIEIFISPYKKISLLKLLMLKHRIQRLIKGVPLAYILKCSYFLNRQYFINRHVLIPRPETEELTTYILTHLAKKKNLKLLDIGTGSGVIPISIKIEKASWEIDALDLSFQALKVAKKNSQRLLSSKDAINFIQADIKSLKFIESYKNTNYKYDVIVSNPPYIGQNDRSIEKRVKQYEPKVALFAGENGLDLFKIISKQLPYLLKKGGELFVEFGAKQNEHVKKIFCHFNKQVIIKDLSGKERFFYGNDYNGNIN